MKTIDVLLSPADFAALRHRNLDSAACVVFDVFRATSSMITALANGAAAVIPVAEIPEALAAREKDRAVLLAGERNGLRIRADQTGGVGFDLGNSPREFTAEKVAGKTVVMTTTNGTRALKACEHARSVLAGSFLNLTATAEAVARCDPEMLLVVCAGTFEETAYEDALAAGALCDALWSRFEGGHISDSALMARKLFDVAKSDLLAAASGSRNGRRLSRIPELRGDVAFCLGRDLFDFAASRQADGTIRKRHA